MLVIEIIGVLVVIGIVAGPLLASGYLVAGWDGWRAKETDYTREERKAMLEKSRMLGKYVIHIGQPTESGYGYASSNATIHYQRGIAIVDQKVKRQTIHKNATRIDLHQQGISIDIGNLFYPILFTELDSISLEHSTLTITCSNGETAALLVDRSATEEVREFVSTVESHRVAESLR